MPDGGSANHKVCENIVIINNVGSKRKRSDHILHRPNPYKLTPIKVEPEQSPENTRKRDIKALRKNSSLGISTGLSSPFSQLRRQIPFSPFKDPIYLNPDFASIFGVQRSLSFDNSQIRPKTTRSLSEVAFASDIPGFVRFNTISSPPVKLPRNELLTLVNASQR